MHDESHAPTRRVCSLYEGHTPRARDRPEVEVVCSGRRVWGRSSYTPRTSHNVRRSEPVRSGIVLPPHTYVRLSYINKLRPLSRVPTITMLDGALAAPIDVVIWETLEGGPLLELPSFLRTTPFIKNNRTQNAFNGRYSESAAWAIQPSASTSSDGQCQHRCASTLASSLPKWDAEVFTPAGRSVFPQRILLASSGSQE